MSPPHRGIMNRVFLVVITLNIAVLRASLEDDGWHAAADGEGEDYYDGLSAEEILNTEFPDYTDYNDKRTIDQIIAAAGTEKGAAASAAENGEVNLDMDMNMDPIQYKSEYGNGNGFTSARMANSKDLRPKKERLAGSGREHINWRWPKNIIPYRIDPGYSEEERNIILSGMKMWMEKTCIKFEPAGSPAAKSTNHKNYLYIFHGKGCWSMVGYEASLGYTGAQRLSLNKTTCMHTGVVAHELGHAIGLNHEQNREDRDKYVQILENNIEPDKKTQFALKTEGHSTFGTQYDYCSVMHYGPQFFTLGYKYFTMIPKDLGYISVIGHQTHVTYTDATIVNKMYRCGITASKTPCHPRPCTDSYTASTCKKLQSQQPSGVKSSNCDSAWNSKGDGCQKFADMKWCKKDGDHYGDNWLKEWGTFEKWADGKGRTALVCPQCGCETGKARQIVVRVKGFVPIAVGCHYGHCWRKLLISKVRLNYIFPEGHNHALHCKDARQCERYEIARLEKWASKLKQAAGFKF